MAENKKTVKQFRKSQVIIFILIVAVCLGMVFYLINRGFDYAARGIDASLKKSIDSLQ